MRGRIVLTVCGLVVALFLGCGQKKLTKLEAEKLLRSCGFMNELATTRLVLSRNLMFPAADLLAEHREMTPFINLGLVEVRPNEVLWGHPVGAKFVLTLDGEREAAGWRPAAGPGGEEAWLVPTARKDLLLVQQPAVREGTAECSFIWRWTPTRVGAKVGAPKGAETWAARFHLAGDQWYLDESSIVQLSASGRVP
jgi:hypothetical protein